MKDTEEGRRFRVAFTRADFAVRHREPIEPDDAVAVLQFADLMREEMLLQASSPDAVNRDRLRQAARGERCPQQ